MQGKGEAMQRRSDTATQQRSLKYGANTYNTAPWQASIKPQQTRQRQKQGREEKKGGDMSPEKATSSHHAIGCDGRARPGTISQNKLATRPQLEISAGQKKSRLAKWCVIW